MKKRILPIRFWNNNELTEKERSEYKNTSNQISGIEFIEILKNNFTPFLKELGFKGSKNNFYKKNSPWIYVVNIHKDKYGGELTINVGIHLDFIENALDALPIPSKFDITDCIIDKNLSLENNNSWLVYGKNSIEAIETVEYMKELVFEQGIPFIQKFNNYPKPFNDITIEEIKTGSKKYLEYGINEKLITWVHFIIFLAKVSNNSGNKEKAIELLNLAKSKEIDRFSGTLNSPLIPRIELLIRDFR
ncbi:DUF4304 domain-containing protein [Flavobacterium sp. HJJ]|uniref:DUF4304 domain-containing protein n=1 Tax=Flavobacterium sp. HJJ TaxID=2783792 RepID=UPI00188A415F|nr:DUF4304 domain-containing protein [Flavobacterium sp. HJJ]MBF4473221.1 DUF4304 domain-containing protein [Flavobacterium sp. HJJ]